MKNILITLFLFNGIVLFSQTNFFKLFSGTGYDVGEGVAQLADSSYVVTGSSSSQGIGPNQAFIMKLDKLGNKKWTKFYGGEESESGRRIFSLGSNGFMVVGFSNSGVSHDFDVYAFRTDTLGNLLWENRFDNGGWEKVNDAVLLSDTSVFIAANTTNTQDGEQDVWLMRISKNGSLLWSDQIENEGEDEVRRVISEESDTLILAGKKYFADSLHYVSYAAKMSIDGVFQWEQLGNTIHGKSCINDIVPDGLGNYKVLGERFSQISNSWDETNSTLLSEGILNLYSAENSYDVRNVYAVKCNSCIGNKYFSVQQSIHSGIPTFINGEDAFIFRGTSDIWWDGYDKNYGQEGQDQFNQMIPTLDGYAMAVGYVHVTDNSQAVMLVKIGSQTNFPSYNDSQITQILAVENDTEISYFNVFPNPVNSILNIKGVAGFDVKVVNSLGQVLYSEKDCDETLTFNVDQLSVGVYTIHASKNGKFISSLFIKE